MKKIGLLLFAITLVAGVVIARFTSLGNSAIKSPVSFLFGSKIKGSGNLTTSSRNVSNFKGVEVGGIINVEIKRSEKLSVVIEADDNILPLIKTEVSNGVLEISTRKRFKTPNNITVKISAPDINSVDTSGVANVVYEGVETDSLSLESSGASKISVSGNVGSLTVDMSGASRVKAVALKANKANIDGSGASSARVDVTSSLVSDLSGASSLTYSGSPAELKKSISGGASIRKAD
jgi:hypothetical protein